MCDNCMGPEQKFIDKVHNFPIEVFCILIKLPPYHNMGHSKLWETRFRQKDVMDLVKKALK